MYYHTGESAICLSVHTLSHWNVITHHPCRKTVMLVPWLQPKLFLNLAHDEVDHQGTDCTMARLSGIDYCMGWNGKWCDTQVYEVPSHRYTMHWSNWHLFRFLLTGTTDGHYKVMVTVDVLKMPMSQRGIYISWLQASGSTRYAENFGTLLFFHFHLDTTGQAPNFQDKSRPFWDGWQLWVWTFGQARVTIELEVRGCFSTLNPTPIPPPGYAINNLTAILLHVSQATICCCSVPMVKKDIPLGH